MIIFIKKWILIRLMIRRLKKDGIKYHSTISAYSQAFINCAIAHKRYPIVKDGFWFIGDVQGTFCRLKKMKDSRKDITLKWVRLSSWSKVLEFKEKFL